MLGLEVISFLHKHVFVVFLSYFFNYIYILEEKMQKFLFFLLIAFQILHVFLLDISVHCELLEYAYI
jgi:hypothetical protein